MTTIMTGNRYLIISGDTAKMYVEADYDDPDSEASWTTQPLAATLYVHPSMATKLLDEKWRAVVTRCKDGTLQVGQLSEWDLFWKDAQVVTFFFSIRKEGS